MIIYFCKAYYAWKYGIAINSKDLSEVGKVSKLSAFTIAMGLPNQIESDAPRAGFAVKDRKKALDEFANTVLKLRREAEQARQAGNYELFMEKEKTVGQLMSAFPDNEIREIIRQVNSKFKFQDGLQGYYKSFYKIFPEGSITEDKLNRVMDYEKVSK